MLFAGYQLSELQANTSVRWQSDVNRVVGRTHRTVHMDSARSGYLREPRVGPGVR